MNVCDRDDATNGFMSKTELNVEEEDVISKY